MKILTLLFCVISLSCSSTKKNIGQVIDKAEDISPLLIGETLPKTNLQDNNGNTIKLENIINQKSTLLVFYRGGWCPYCNLQLSSLASIENEIIELGYQIIAISPDDFENLNDTEEKGQLKYQLFSDKNGEFIQKMGIAYQTPLLTKGYVSTKKHKGKMSDIIPVPTVMIVDRMGVIQFEYINPNYKERLSSDILLAVLKTLKKN